MNVGRLIVLFAMAGGVVAAYRYGYLDDLAVKLGLPPQAPANWPGMGGDTVTGGGTDPVAGGGSTAGLNRWEALLVMHQYDVQPWAWINRRWAAAMIKVESGTIGASAVSSKGALGLLQVMPGTRAQMWERGYRKYPNTDAALRTEAGGIYFGTAYLQYLSGIKSDRAWITKAYFGGPGWEGQSAAYKGQCEEYLDMVERSYSELYNAGVA